MNEAIVLNANGKGLKDEDQIRTCKVSDTNY